ncbi:GspE/PulE family protein [Pandoraea bronchicola]|uniref:Toxin coregulated pilus biosynthesis protein T n=1 Tax=Pandoraea bronchicola TaxID=2508287 RepID=A0A5E5BLY2_9BURK|nr:ATPase, T2SS/T4P/T4SS family [Pandoraea bronchicola]VVE86694.1 Toxin coregulated pilus biosynthesis protein T [Pandoraea bronchicola]
MAKISDRFQAALSRVNSRSGTVARPIADLRVDDIQMQGWRQDLGITLAGAENGSLVLVAPKPRLFLVLLEHTTFVRMQGSDLLSRFEQAVRATHRLDLEGIYVGTTEEILLMQSRLQQQGGSGARTEEQRTGAYRNFDLIIERAIDARASDVHFEFREGQHVRVRMRIHGKLRATSETDRLSRDYHAMLDAVSAAYNSRADPSSRSHNHFDEDQHQSCSIPLNLRNRKYQLRLQSIRENRGVDVVLRLLVNEAVDDDVMSLSELGYSDDQIEVLENAVYRSPGLTIIAGETGSGKSTTLRTMMMYERDSGKKFFSIEDPVEYIQPHVTQIPIQRRAEDGHGESAFGAAAKVLLRGDPDKLMPGEIRDVETGSFAKSMTETGHQVLSTVHASSAFGIIPRLISEEIGMPVSAVTSPNFLTAMVYQKLIPVLCDHCKLPAVGHLDEMTLCVIGGLGIDTAGVRVAGPGCDHCKGRGTAGQTVVAEVCELSDELLDLLRQSKFWEAQRYWRAHHDGDLTSPVMYGKSAMEHAIYKMAQGRIDPADIEAAFHKLKKFQVWKGGSTSPQPPRRLASV